MFAILQSLQELYTKKNIFAGIESPTKSIINNENSASNTNKPELSDKMKLYVRDSIKKGHDSIEKKHIKIVPYDGEKENPPYMYFYALNSLFFFGLGAFAFSRWKK
jgi:ATP-dependent helicase/DNAse subunit B